MAFLGLVDWGMRILVRPILALLLGAFVMAPPAQADGQRTFEIVAMGDAPYNIPDDYARFDALIGEVNRLKPAFSVHVGDFKTSSTPCSDEIFLKAFNQFNTFDQPLVYTPGDNEWTDCHKNQAGAYDPRERLDRLREMFFKTAESLGKKRLKMTRQAGKYVENARWEYQGVVFVTAHVVGSNNNLLRNTDAMLEAMERNVANVAWLKEAYAVAGKADTKALVVTIQADPRFEVFPEERSGFNDIIDTLESGTLALGKPVLLMHGDFHVFKVDKPLKAKSDKRIIEKFTRLEVFGDPDIHAVRVRIDPDDPQPFSFRPMMIQANFLNHPK